jgi:hypothetical protein
MYKDNWRKDKGLLIEALRKRESCTSKARRSPAKEMNNAWGHGVWVLARTDAPWLHGPYNAI